MSVVGAIATSTTTGTYVDRGGRLPWVSMALSLAASLVHLVPEVAETLALRPAEVWQGQVWQLITGHFVHFNQAHAVGDILAFAVWAAAVELYCRRLVLYGVVGSSLIVSGLILFWYPELGQYRGLSAIDCALVAQLIAIGLTDPRFAERPLLQTLFYLCGAAFLGKTVFEFAMGHAILAPNLGQDVVLLPGVHAFGILGGLLTLAIWRRMQRAAKRAR